eukprot:860416-Rhodomonas_salina.1
MLRVLYLGAVLGADGGCGRRAWSACRSSSEAGASVGGCRAPSELLLPFCSPSAPLLLGVCSAWGGADTADAPSAPAIALRALYALSGTDVGYAATRRRQLRAMSEEEVEVIEEGEVTSPLTCCARALRSPVLSEVRLGAGEGGGGGGRGRGDARAH